MEKSVIHTSSAPAAIGPYSQAIRVGDLVFVSGQVPFEPATKELVTGSIEAETSRVLENVKAILTAAGTTLGNVVKTTIFLKDMDDFQRVNETYASFFTAPYPARSTVEVARLPRDVRVEIECIAKV